MILCGFLLEFGKFDLGLFGVMFIIIEKDNIGDGM